MREDTSREDISVLGRILNLRKALRTDSHRPGIHRTYFDARWYLQAYPDVARAVANGDPSPPTDQATLRHYLRFGWREGRNPCPYFDTLWYLERNPAVKESRTEPLLHYVEQGWRSGHAPSLYFDAAWYLGQNPDVATARIEPLQHYLQFGHREGRINAN
jgi:hypothetical protein